MGAKPYHKAHARGVKIIGATAHYATTDLDAGPIIEQVYMVSIVWYFETLERETFRISLFPYSFTSALLFCHVCNIFAPLALPLLLRLTTPPSPAADIEYRQDVTRISHSDSVADMIRKGRDLERLVLARAVRWHLASAVLVDGNKTVVFMS